MYWISFHKTLWVLHSIQILPASWSLSSCPLTLWATVLCVCLFAQPCPTLCHPMACSPPGSSVHGILQARILEWVAMPSSRGSSQPRDRNQVSHIAGGFFTIWATREAPLSYYVSLIQGSQSFINSLHPREKPTIFTESLKASHCWNDIDIWLLRQWS